MVACETTELRWQEKVIVMMVAITKEKEEKNKPQVLLIYEMMSKEADTWKELR